MQQAVWVGFELATDMIVLPLVQCNISISSFVMFCLEFLLVAFYHDNLAAFCCAPVNRSCLIPLWGSLGAGSALVYKNSPAIFWLFQVSVLCPPTWPALARFSLFFR